MAAPMKKQPVHCADCPEVGDTYACKDCGMEIEVTKACACADCECVCFVCCGKHMEKTN